MAQLNITNDELRSVKQSIQNKYTRIELLNSNFQVVDSLEGITENGSINVNADSDMRRSATLKILITDSSFEVNSGSKVWLDKYITLYLGTKMVAKNEVIYTKIGTFVVDAPTFEYDALNNTLELSLLDLMSKLSGVRNGYLPGVPVTIQAGENIRQAIIDTFLLSGFTKYICEEAPDSGLLPIELNFSQGSTIYTVLSGLRDVYPSYEIYFDVDGVFHYEPIPTGENEPVQIDDSLWKDIVITEKVEVDFQNIKNYIEVWGRTHDPAYFSTTTTYSSLWNRLTLTIDEVDSYTDGVIYGFTLTNNTGITAPTLRINSLSSYNVLIEPGRSANIEAESGEVYYCVQYVGGTTPYFRWIGHLQSYAEVKDENPDSPFYVGGTVGEIRLPLYGGDYDNCMTDDLALQRAKYELYIHTNMQNTVTLTCLPVAWLDVNTLVQYTTHRNHETNLYLIKSFSFGFDIDDTMSVTLMKYYPDYPGL